MLPVLRIAKSYLVVTFMLTCAVHAQHRKPKTYHDHSHEPLCNAHQELHNKNSKQYKNPIRSVPISGILQNSHRDDSTCNWDTPNYQSFANLSPEEVANEVKTFTRECTARWLFDYNGNHSPAIFSDGNLQAVIQSAVENAETYDGTYSSGMYGYLYYLHAALFHDWYEEDINISQEVISSLVEPIELMSENLNLYDISEPALHTLNELTIVIDVRTVRHTQGATKIIKDILKKIVVEENWKGVPEDLYFEYGTAYNNIHWNISRGVGNQDTLYHQVLSTDSELFNLMGQLGVYKELKEIESFSYLVENVPWTLREPAAVDILNEFSIDQIEKIYNAKLYERLEIEWIDLVLAILDNGDCSTINICDESKEKIIEDLNDMLFPNEFSFDDGKMIVKTSLPIDKVQTLYYAAKQVQASFFRLLQNDNPLPEDTNDVLNMVVYGSPEEYEEYQYFLNGLSTDNGGIYIEEDATFYTYDRTLEQSIYSLEELFRHEYVHYLQARFLINGLFGDTPFYKDGRLTWFNEGMAEFIAGSTSRDGIKIRETILDRIERDGSNRLEVNDIIGATYDDGFKFYRYGCLLWSYWYDNDRDFYKNIFDLVISDDLEGYDLLLETLKSDENLQNAYDQYIDQNIADDNTWQPTTEWLTDNNLMADSPGELNIESTDAVTINNIGLGETEMNKRFLVTGIVELLEPNEENNIIGQFEASLNEFLTINARDESVNNLHDAVAYFEDIDTEANVAQFTMTGPLRKGAMLSPIAGFSALENVISINGSIQYLNKTENTGIDFSWEFEGGEPSTSIAKNPIVTYYKPGLYNVKLTTNNEAGTSEIAKSSYVMVLNSELEGYCATNNTSSENYISSVQFGEIQNRSEWENYTQTNWFTSLLPADTIPLKISTPYLERGTNNTLGVWVDWNQNSVFGDEEEETIVNLASIEEPLNMQVVVPESAKGGLTKMRVRINNWSEPSQPCGDDTIGEVEDYYIFVGTGEEKPIADFNFNQNLILNTGTIDFTDQSDYFPAAWSWTFEEANLSTSSERNPSASFDKLGLHEITLEVENKNGISETKQSKHILVTDKIPANHCQASHSNGDNYIKNLQFGDINVKSEWDGYSSNESYFALVDTSETHELNISTAWLERGSSHTIGVWVDWNQNSVFGDEEEETVINVASIDEPLNMQVTVPATAKSGLTKMRVRINNWSQPSQPCGDDTIGEVEDYFIFVGTGQEKPIADFRFSQNFILNEGTVDFTDQSEHFPIAWTWTFEDASPSTSNERNPSVSFDKLGFHEVTLDVENKNGISETKLSKQILVVENIETDHCQVNHSDGDNYITKVQFGDINVTSEWDGYSLNDDYFALIDTSETYPLSVSTAWLEEGLAHTLGVWIDWNQNSIFGDEDEETIINVASIEEALNMQVLVPSSAKSGLTKMRVRVNHWAQPSQPCGDDTIGEVEDYFIYVGTGEEKPIANFSFNRNLIFDDGTVDFTDQSIHFPNTWSWTFEDASTSTSDEQNPSVSYDELGLHEVTLQVENENGIGETLESKHILVTDKIPSDHCQVSHTDGDNYITKVQFGDINVTSEWDGFSMNDDYFALVDTSEIHQLNISTAWLAEGIAHTLGVWVDWNQNSIFGDDEEETIINMASIDEPLNMQVAIPASAKSGITKMRVRINNWNEPSRPCGDDTIGEVEDYIIFVGNGEEKPVPDFNFNQNLILSEGTIDFTDQSKYFPLSWSWTFEDASPSTSDEQNPSVSYDKLGLHEVTLEVENEIGISESRQSKHILVTDNIETDHCQVSHSDGDNYISRVQFGDINVISEWDGYSLNDDYFALVDTTETHQLNISTSWLENGSNHTLGVWIDWNQNSIFGDEDEETIINVASIDEPLNMQVVVPATAQSGITKMRVRINSWPEPSQPCGDDGIGEVEDYVIFVGSGEEKPIADFNFDRNLIVEEGTVDFTDKSKHFPIAWSWTFEEANPPTSDERNPSVSYNKLGLHEVTLEVENEKGIGETKQSKYILVTDEITSDHCQVSHTDGDNYITRVQFGDINMSSEWEGYSLNEHYFALVDTSEIYELNINTLWSEQGIDHTLGVWIDWNEDGDFDDSEETIFNNPTALGPYSINVTVPSNASTGLKKMRLRINNWSEPSEPCGEDTIGEVEDYLLWVRGTDKEDDDDQIVTSTSIIDEIKLFPNPGNGKITLVPNSTMESFSVVLYNTTGKIIDYQIIRNAKESYPLDFSYLSTGVYHLRIINQGAVFKKKLIISR